MPRRQRKPCWSFSSNGYANRCARRARCDANQTVSITVTNLFDDLPAAMPAEVVEPLLSAGRLRIERIVSCGQSSPPDFWYDQAQPEWVLLLQGAARLEFEDRVVELKPGDFVNIPAHCRHRVHWTTPDERTIWLAIHYAE